MDLVATAVLALVLGFAAGFTTFKRSTRWCPTCGATLCCVECPEPAPRARRRPVPPAGRPPQAEQPALRDPGSGRAR
jgi:hypothetical protein